MKRDTQEYLSFLESESAPSAPMDERIVRLVKSEQRSEWVYFIFKIALIHLLSGLVTFFFCPQFGLNPFKASPHLPHIFMSYGLWACGLFCGSVFMGSGAIIRVLFLSERERIIAHHRGLWSTLILSSVLYAGFMLLGSQLGSLAINYSIVFFISWLFGALLFERLSALVFSPLLTQRA